jgi:glucosamine-6-phosphate deaminase
MTPSGSAVGHAGQTPSFPPDFLHERAYDRLPVRVYSSAAALGAASAQDFAVALKETLASRDVAGVIFASANSQLPFLEALRARQDIEWRRVHVLHMDEYLGMSSNHPASFRRFLYHHLVQWVHPREFHELGGDAADPIKEIERYSVLLENLNPSICVLGIGENGHLAFNDPPADFATDNLVHRVELDDSCRRQQWMEGHFPSLDDVPTEALSLTIPALLRPSHVLCVVPERRKARAVRAVLKDPVSPDRPASILRTVSFARLYLDTSSASLL